MKQDKDVTSKKFNLSFELYIQEEDSDGSYGDDRSGNENEDEGKY